MKRYRYYDFQNGLKIIAPLKCGTRFIDVQKIYPEPELLFLSFEQIIPYLTTDVIWVYRNPTEHMLSALVTDFYLNSKHTTLTKLAREYVNGMGIHWEHDVYTNLYPIWNKIGFKFLELKDLSILFNNEVCDSKLYDHKSLIGVNDLMDIKKSIPKDLMDKLDLFAKEETIWLGRMVRDERDVITLSDWNNLNKKYDDLKKEYDEFRKNYKIL